MNAEDRKLVRSLLDQRVLALGVLVDGLPHVGQVPFALRPDLSGLLIHVSGLARHTAGLTPGAPFSALLAIGDRPDEDPLALPRLTLDGRVSVLDKGTAGYDEAARIYQGRLPSSSVTFQLGDFRLCELVPEGGRVVGGFARAFDVRPDDLRELAAEGGTGP